MKRLLFMMVIVNTLIISTLSSCNKSDSLPPPPPPPPPSVAQPPVNLDLVANNWINYENHVYINTFRGVLASVNASGDRAIIVYIEEDGKEAQISQRHITYRHNELWATNSKTDVSIIYRCSTELPFSSMNIRVEVK